MLIQLILTITWQRYYYLSHFRQIERVDNLPAVTRLAHLFSIAALQVTTGFMAYNRWLYVEFTSLHLWNLWGLSLQGQQGSVSLFERSHLIMSGLPRIISL